MKKILLLIMCFVAIHSTTYAQICEGPLTVTISGSADGNALEASEDAVNQPTCAGPTGSIEISIVGGTPDYTVVWNKDGEFYSNDEDITNAGGGVYDVQITDASGCETTLGPWTLEEPSDLVVSGETVDVTCNTEDATGDGSITLTVDGGTPGYTYAWTTTGGSGIVDGQKDQTGLTAGTYSVDVMDAAGCNKVVEFTITAPEAFTVSLDPTDPNCNSSNGTVNGEIAVTTEGGEGNITYAWTTSDGAGLEANVANQTGLSAGTYTLVATDENNCTVTSEVTLEGAEPMAIAETIVDATCASDNGEGNGSISIVVTGGDENYTYDWTTTDGSGLDASAQNQTGLTAGTYAVEVSDGNGCSTTGEYTIDAPDAIVADVTSASPGCFGEDDGSITVNSITGGAGGAIADYTLTWSTSDGDGLVAGSATQTGLSAGTYTLVITDANDCSVTSEYEITEPTELVLNQDLVQQLSCHQDSGEPDGAIEISITGGSGNYTYAWTTTNGSGLDETAQNQSGLSAGTYNVVVSDGTGCSVDEQFTLVEPAVVAIGHTIIPPSCSGDAASIWTAVSGGQGSDPTDYTYIWSTTDGSGITPGTVHQQNLSAGTYFLTVADSNGCSNEAEFLIEEPAGLDLTADVTSEILCNGDNGELSLSVDGGTGPYQYSIDGDNFLDSPVFGDLAAGEYEFTVQDANGCMSTVELELTQPAQLTAGTCTEVQDLCQVSEGEIKVEVAGGVAPYIINWTSSNGGGLNETSGQEVETDGGSFTFTGAEGGKSYSFVIIDANGCQIP